MSDSSSLPYTAFAAHVRSTLKPEYLSRAADALDRAAEVRRRILNLHHSNSQEEDEARAEIYDLIDAPDITKLNRLFRTPINILPSDMKYSEKAAENARQYFTKRTVDTLNVDPVTQTPASAKFDSIDDFDEWSKQLHTMHPCNVLDEGKPIQEHRLELDAEIEQCVRALRTFETKFSDINEVPDIPNKLNENVHEKIKELSRMINAIDEFTRAKISIAERGERIEETTKAAPAMKTSQDIEDILCQVENLAFPSACDD